MAKIAYVKAWGLWSHFETVFEFSPDLTVITGPNDSGKSALIRIIKWVAQGEPSGENFIFTVKDDKTGEVIKQAKEGKAEIGLDNGIVVTKTRRKGKTTYTINTIPEPFEKAEVPEEIKQALGIDKYSFGDFETYLNYAFQLEAPFLISESPSVGAKVLGKLAGTEAVDLAIREVSKRTHKTREEKRIAEREIERINGDLLDYQDLDELKQRVQACEYLVEELETAAKKKDNLKDLDHKLITAQEAIGRLEIELDALAIVPDLEEDLKDVEKAQQRYNTLLDLYSKLDQNVKAIADITAQLAEYENLDVAASILVSIEAKDRRLNTLNSLSTQLTSYTQDIITAEKFLATVENLDVAAANLEYVEKSTNKLDKLRDLRGQLTLTDALVKRLNDDLENLKGAEAAAAILEIVTEKATRLELLKQLLEEFTVKDTTAKQATKELEAAEANYKTAQEELEEAWKATGGICPLCNQIVDLDHTHK